MNAEDMNDIRETLNGNGDAYSRIVERYQEVIGARMRRFTRDSQQHKELVQDVFVEAYLSLKSYKAKAPLEHWLSKISTGVGYRFWRARDRQKLCEPLDVDAVELIAAGRDGADPEEAADLLYSLLDKMPPRDRMVLMLRYVEEHTVEETAELMGWTQAMVKVQAWRARKKLKKYLLDAGMEVNDERN